MQSLNGIRVVTFNDYTDFVSEKSHNGGSYGFWKDYYRLENGMWRASYGTTADFEFCPCCGSFGSHEDDDYDSGYSCGDFEEVTEKELLHIINNFKETDKEFFSYKTEEDVKREEQKIDEMFGE